MAIRIHPSILGADFVNLERELARIPTADAVHVDVMDSYFVEDLTFGPQTVKRIREVSPVPLDVHLMISDPDRNAVRYAEVGAQSVTFHVEAARDPKAIISALHAAGARAAIAMKPATPIQPYLELFHLVDMVLVCTVEPGRGGQPFLVDQLAKVEELCRYLEENNLSPLVEVDGGITRETLPAAYRSGANTFVAGSSVYGHGEPVDNIQILRESVGSAV